MRTDQTKRGDVATPPQNPKTTHQNEFQGGVILSQTDVYLHLRPLNSERQYRLLNYLISQNCTREQADSICGASNSPAVVQALRRLGWTIVTTREDVIDRDGKSVQRGRYRFDREFILRAIETCNQWRLRHAK